MMVLHLEGLPVRSISDRSTVDPGQLRDVPLECYAADET